MDKLLHFIGGFILSFTGYVLDMEPITLHTIAGMFWGTLKEVLDVTGYGWRLPVIGRIFNRNKVWDSFDLVFTITGALSAGMLAEWFDWDICMNQQYVKEVVLCFIGV